MSLFLLVYWPGADRPRDGHQGTTISMLSLVWRAERGRVGMWRVEEHRRLDKQLEKVPIEILKRYEKWVDIATMSGPSGLRAIKGFHDEALQGGLGLRSCRLGDRYRVLYRFDAASAVFQVVAVTPHEYGRYA